MGYEADAIFERLKTAIDAACRVKDYEIATKAAGSEGLQPTDASRPMSLRLEYRGQFDDAVVELHFRSFDQSQAFSIRPDMNRFSLALMSGEQTLRQHSNEFED